ncbi:MAG: NTP transferase domain-containing protein, partial [Pseudomonadota bacterium]
MTMPASSKRARAAVILAAGKSTRMKSTMSKVLHPLAGRPLIEWVRASAIAAGCDRIICVVGEANADVRAKAEALGMEIAVQEPQNGTGHAVLCAREVIGDFDGDVAILFADTPLIRIQTLLSVFDALASTDVAVLGFEAKDPGAYGRLIETDGCLTKIVEAKDATADELAVTLCNSGVLAARRDRLFEALDRVTN